jgi:hypothetical protein
MPKEWQDLFNQLGSDLTELIQMAEDMPMSDEVAALIKMLDEVESGLQQALQQTQNIAFGN